MTESEKGHAVSILVQSPQGTPLVRDPHKHPRPFWKLPGGKNEPGETPAETALRELKEETGLVLAERDLGLVCEEDRTTHFFFLYKAVLASLPKLKKQGDEGEEVALFSMDEIFAMHDFFPNHRRLLFRSGLLDP